MKVVIDWRAIFDPRGGMYRAFHAILPRLAHQHGVELGFLRRAYNNPIPANLEKFPLTLPFPFRRFPEGKAKEWSWGRYLKPFAPAIYHCPYYSEAPQAGLTPVATFYDLIVELFPEKNRGPIFDRLRARKKRIAFGAKRLIAISQSTADDLTRVFKIPRDRIDVIPLGVDFAFLSHPVSSEESEGLKRKWRVERPFLLVVGGREAHKNFFTFLDAYSGSPLKKDFDIVAAGEPWNPSEKSKIQSLGLENRIRNPVWPDDSELRALYQNCAALVYPSRYEGFGLPPLEAMAAGAPVALSRVSSLPEVAGDAGFFFDPKSLRDMSDVIAEAARAGRASAPVLAGRARAKQFSWDETARLTFQTYQKALVSG